MSGVATHRAFLLVFTGQTASALGNAVFRITLAFLAVAVSPSGGLLAAVLVAQTVGFGVSVLFGGVLTDRRSARGLLLATDLLRCGIVGAVAGLAALDLLVPLHLIGLGLLFGLIEGVFQPALKACVPELLPADLILAGTAWSSAARRLVAVLGAPLGGLLVAAWGPANGMVVNAVSFAVAAILLWFAGAWPYPHQARPRRESVPRELATGVSYVVRQPWLRVLMALSFAVVALVFSGAFALLPVILSATSSGAARYGLLLGATALGGLLGAVALARLPATQQAVRYCLFGAVVCGAYAWLAFAPAVWLLMILGVLAGAATNMANIDYTSLLQRLVPRALLGRVMGIDLLVSIGLQPLGYAAVAVAATAVSPRTVLVAGCAIAALLCLTASLAPAVRGAAAVAPEPA